MPSLPYRYARGAPVVDDYDDRGYGPERRGGGAAYRGERSAAPVAYAKEDGAPAPRQVAGGGIGLTWGAYEGVRGHRILIPIPRT